MLLADIVWNDSDIFYSVGDQSSSFLVPSRRYLLQQDSMGSWETVKQSNKGFNDFFSFVLEYPI